VGGKTGVNHQDGKNLIGAFYQPRLVVIDVAVIQSLPRREFIAGLAEVIKYGVIDDASLFRMLEEKIEKLISLDRELLTHVIARSCAIKAKVVEKDEREDNIRAVLNFGHTIGHALEVATRYEKYLHGEAVGIGMAQAAAISVQQGFCDQRSFGRIRKLIAKASLPVEIPRDVSMQALVQGMEVDKKSAGGKIKFVMCAGVGKTRFHTLAPGEILRALGA
jgi:3-dehydroquinate synthase